MYAKKKRKKLQEVTDIRERILFKIESRGYKTRINIFQNVENEFLSLNSENVVRGEPKSRIFVKKCENSPYRDTFFPCNPETKNRSSKFEQKSHLAFNSKDILTLEKFNCRSKDS